MRQVGNRKLGQPVVTWIHLVHILVHILAMVHRITQNNCADCADCLKFLVCGDVQDVVHISLTWRNTDFSGQGKSGKSGKKLLICSVLPDFSTGRERYPAFLSTWDAKTLLQAQHRHGMPRHATATRLKMFARCDG